MVRTCNVCGKEIPLEDFYFRKDSKTYEQKRQMYRLQKGKCAICNKPMLFTHDCMVDHNHITKKVRALLCTRCNAGLSFLERPEYIKGVKEYLKKYDS